MGRPVTAENGYQYRYLTKKKKSEGWAEASSNLKNIEANIAFLRQQQQRYLEGKTRLSKDSYDFPNWTDVSSLWDFKYMGFCTAWQRPHLGEEKVSGHKLHYRRHL